MEKELLHVAIKERQLLNRPGSDKQTYHIVLEAPIDYQVGDCIGIYPPNDPEDVSTLLKVINATGDEIIIDRDGNKHQLRQFLETKANLCRVSKKLLPSCEEMNVAQALSAHPEIQLSAQELCDHLSPLLPRFYSIASSKHVVGNEIHLTVSVTGLCSSFLCHRAPFHEPILPIFLQKAHTFTLSEQSHHYPVIMIGPGTGIAPFRGFMQERLIKSKCSQNWLFFGERNRALDFYYEEYWSSLIETQKLRLSTAFSRDQNEKIYVQHRMLEHASELWQWIQQGAYLFVCGDASRMAKEVDATLHQLVQEQGKMSEMDARTYIKALRKEGRYLRDVY